MEEKGVKKLRRFLSFLSVCVVLLSLGCQHQKTPSSKKPRVLSINKVVAIGFMAALAGKDKSGAFQNPLSGSVVMAEPVSQDVVQAMNRILFESVVVEKNFNLISRSQAVGVYSSIVASNEKVGLAPIEVIKKVGEKFEADAVLVGHIYRWREREGKDFAAERPASVSFDLHMIRPSDGAILWKSKFDKTQLSLSENVLDVGTFLEGGGRWMTAEKLSMLGLRKMIEDMPQGQESKD